MYTNGEPKGEVAKFINVGIINSCRDLSPLWKRGAGGIRNKSKRIFILPQISPNPSLLKRGEQLLYP